MFLKFNYINKVICSFIILFLFTIRANAELKIDINILDTEVDNIIKLVIETEKR